MKGAGKGLYVVGSGTHVGLVRGENQDAVGYFRTEHGNWTLLVVCDGMGGHAGGQQASKLCVETMSRVFGARVTSVGAKDALAEAIRTANSTIHRQAGLQPELNGMGTTCVALALRDNEAFMAHVGDSRIYRVRPRQVTRLTHDHSSVQRLVDGGLITEDQAESHPDSNVLTRCIGVQPDVEPEVRGPEVVLPGDRFVLCSDGLWGPVKQDEIAAMASAFSSQDAVDRLIALANDRGGQDNISVQVVHRSDRYKPTGVFSPEKFSARRGATDLDRFLSVSKIRNALAWSKLNRTHTFVAGVLIGVMLVAGIVLTLHWNFEVPKTPQVVNTQDKDGKAVGTKPIQPVEGQKTSPSAVTTSKSQSAGTPPVVEGKRTCSDVSPSVPDRSTTAGGDKKTAVTRTGRTSEPDKTKAVETKAVETGKPDQMEKSTESKEEPKSSTPDKAASTAGSTGESVATDKASNEPVDEVNTDK